MKNIHFIPINIFNKLLVESKLSFEYNFKKMTQLLFS